MKYMIKNILAFVWQRRAYLVPLMLLGLFIHPGLAFAGADTDEDVQETLASLLSTFLTFLQAILWPVLMAIGDLMDTSLILGPGMEERLKQIWVILRDLVNISFVLVLLFVAFYNVLGLGGGEGELAIKTALPKIVLGLVLVNFTFLGGRVILDLTNVATTAVFALPNSIMVTDKEGIKATKDDFEIKVCFGPKNSDTGEYQKYQELETTDTTSKDNIPIYTRLFCDKDTDGYYTGLKELVAAQYFASYNKNNLGLIMAVNMGALTDQTMLKTGVTTFKDLTVGMIFSSVMFIIFAVTYIVLGIVLIARIGVLWIAMALSPLGVLVYVVPQIKEWAGGGGDLVNKIVKHLIAPIIIGLSMTLGFIMISAWNISSGSSALSNSKVVDTAGLFSTDILISGINDLPQLIIAVGSVIIVWMGVFAAANDTYASALTNGIKGIAEQVGKAVPTGLLMIPTVPVGIKGGEKQSASPMLLYRGLKDKIQDFNYNGTNRELDDMRTKGELPPILKFLYDERGARDMNPESNLKNIKKILEEQRGRSTISPTDAASIAGSMAVILQQKGSGKDNAANLQALEKIRTGLASGDTSAMTDLSRLVRKIHEDPKDSGLSESDISFFNEELRDKKLDTTPPEKPKETKKTTPEPAPAAPEPATPEPAAPGSTSSPTPEAPPTTTTTTATSSPATPSPATPDL